MREEQRFLILRHLQENPEMSQRDLARAVGVSLGGIHGALSALIDTGLVTPGNATGDRRRNVYTLTSRGLCEKTDLTRRFLRLRTEEYKALKSEIAALRDELASPAPGTRPGRSEK